MALCSAVTRANPSREFDLTASSQHESIWLSANVVQHERDWFSAKLVGERIFRYRTQPAPDLASGPQGGLEVAAGRRIPSLRLANAQSSFARVRIAEMAG